jgi:hypothetical protein
MVITAGVLQALAVADIRAAALCTAATSLICTPWETAMVYIGDILQLLAVLIGTIGAVDPNGQPLTIPPDPNYMVIATPATYSVSLPTTGIPPQATAALNALVANLEQTIALKQAIITSIARGEGASAAGNSVWVTNQQQAAQNFGGHAGVLINELPQLQANLAAAFQTAGIRFTFTANDILAVQSAINPSSPPSQIQTEFQMAQQVLSTQLGASSSDLALVLEFMLSADPQAAAALGTGAFPQALTDPSVATASQQLGAALIQNAPSPTTLSPSFNVTLPGDYVAAGVGLRGTTSGNINITGIPSGASVQKAFLYWGMLDNGEDPTLSQLKVNGTSVTGSLIGSGPDTCWGRTNSFTFRADVTSLVTGNGIYALTGVASGGNVLAEGASLVVIYQLSGAPVKTVILDDGNLSIPFGTSAGSAPFSAFTATGPVTATTSFIVGDGQGTQLGPTPTSFTGSGSTINLPNQFAALNGPLWDTSTFNVSTAVGAGSSAASAKISGAGDCLLWSAQALSVTSAPLTTPFTATAAVVQAGVGGDTVANLRGLDPTDAPTLQDELTMVVQFRTIQNPSISVAALTNQLVTGLVNDGVISSVDANTITSDVIQAVVPTGQPQISGQFVSQSVQSPGVVQALVKLQNTGTGTATNIQVGQVVTKTLTGTGTVTVSSPLPSLIPALAVGASANVSFVFNVPSTVRRFSVTESGTVQDMLTRTFSFSTSQLVFE